LKKQEKVEVYSRKKTNVVSYKVDEITATLQRNGPFLSFKKTTPHNQRETVFK
jgi:hypothetical protein